jgi:hypothetical protein
MATLKSQCVISASLTSRTNVVTPITGESEIFLGIKKDTAANNNNASLLYTNSLQLQSWL